MDSSRHSPPPSSTAIGAGGARIDAVGATLLALIIAAVLIINPIGYVGGSTDDTHYLAAARCWASEGGPCLPANHWATRWPLVAPLALSIDLFGLNRAAVGLAPLVYFLLAVGGVLALSRLWFGALAGWIAASLFASATIIAQTALQPMIDTPELTLVVAALVAATVALGRSSWPLAIVAGVCAALAVQARETAVVIVAVIFVAGWPLVRPGQRRLVAVAALAFAATIAFEMLVYAAATGDPLARYRLSFGHVRIPSQELPADFDLRQSPLLNPDYIRAWRREMRIELFWPLDPWFNLVASPRIGPLLIGTLGMLAGCWRWIARDRRASVTRILIAALLIQIIAIYGLAIDPKPRSFLPLVAACCLAGGAAAASAVERGRGLVPLVAVGTIAASGLVVLGKMVNTHAFERVASAWMAAHPGQIALDPFPATTLALVPGIDTLPPPSSGRPLLIVGGARGCETWGLAVLDQSPVIGDGRLCLLRR